MKTNKSNLGLTVSAVAQQNILNNHFALQKILMIFCIGGKIDCASQTVLDRRPQGLP